MRFRRLLMWVSWLIFAGVLASSAVARAQSAVPEIYFVPNVETQFNELALRPEPFGFGSPDSFSPTFLDFHYQGVVRKHGPGTPYLFVTRNRDGAGYLLVVRMGSRGTDGERLRSNRLLRDSPISPVPLQGQPPPTLPDARDTTVALIRFDGNYWPAYRHPGAMQMVGNILALPLTQPLDGNPLLRVAFIDVSNPEAPELTSVFDPELLGSTDFGVGEVALTPVHNPAGPGMRYLMLLTGETNQEVRLYRSLPTNEEDESTDLASRQLRWEELGTWTGEQLDDPGLDTWPCCSSQSHQTIAFVRQQSLDGSLYLIGAFNDEPAIAPGGGQDFLDLYRVLVDRYGNPESSTRLFDHIERKHVTTDSIGGDTAHFAGSTGVYVSPSGELIVYSTEHTNQGPLDADGKRTIRGGEWRHREMVRSDSPTLRPGVEVSSPSEVDEGSDIVLSAHGRAPATRAWIQLFIEDGLGLTDDPFNIEVVADFEDRDKDDFDDFTKLLWYFNDDASSWRWFAPQGCTINAYQHSIGDSSFPGRYKALAGDGLVGADLVKEAADLDAVQSDNAPGSMDGMISAVGFDCGSYYTIPIGIRWDLDGDGSFETVGENPVFSAAALDGPSVVGVPVRAQHPTDSSPLGRSGPLTVDVRVRNVAPSIGSFALVDSGGLVVGSDVPFALVNVPYTGRATFTDPGTVDHQTARLAWGDGVSESSLEFETFSDAFGGALGELAHRHTYAAAGGFTIQLTVTDDDAGVESRSIGVSVLTPLQALEAIVDALDALIAAASGDAQRKALQGARDKLTGNNLGDAANGAIEMLAKGNTQAVLEKLAQAIDELRDAEAAGADVGALIALLVQISASAAASGGV